MLKYNIKVDKNRNYIYLQIKCVYIKVIYCENGLSLILKKKISKINISATLGKKIVSTVNEIKNSFVVARLNRMSLLVAQHFHNYIKYLEVFLRRRTSKYETEDRLKGSLGINKKMSPDRTRVLEP